CGLDFRSIGREQAVGKRTQSQHNYQRNSNDDDPFRPRGRFPSVATLGAVDPQALQILVFGINCHNSIINPYAYSTADVPVAARRTQSRSAARISRREACQAGKIPPNNPIINAKTIAAATTPGVICRPNTTSLNVTWF